MRRGNDDWWVAVKPHAWTQQTSYHLVFNFIIQNFRFTTMLITLSFQICLIWNARTGTRYIIIRCHAIEWSTCISFQNSVQSHRTKLVSSARRWCSHILLDARIELLPEVIVKSNFKSHNKNTVGCSYVLNPNSPIRLERMHQYSFWILNYLSIREEANL